MALAESTDDARAETILDEVLARRVLNPLDAQGPGLTGTVAVVPAAWGRGERAGRRRAEGVLSISMDAPLVETCRHSACWSPVWSTALVVAVPADRTDRAQTHPRPAGDHRRRRGESRRFGQPGRWPAVADAEEPDFVLVHERRPGP